MTGDDRSLEQVQGVSWGDSRAEGDCHPGDLLAAVRRVPDDYWAAHPEESARLAAVT